MRDRSIVSIRARGRGRGLSRPAIRRAWPALVLWGSLPQFLDRRLIGRVPLIGGGLSLLLSDGVYRGAYLERLLTGLLADLGVRTFGDLRTGEEPEQFAWSLVVPASDLSRRSRDARRGSRASARH